MNPPSPSLSLTSQNIDKAMKDTIPALKNEKNVSLVNKNEGLIQKTCGQLTKNSYETYFTPLIQSEELAVNQVLKDNILTDVFITNDGVIHLHDHVNRFTKISLAAKVDINMALNPSVSANDNEFWKLTVSEFNLKEKFIKVCENNNFIRLKLTEAQMIKRYNKNCHRLPFSLEILPSSVVTTFYKENLKDSTSHLDVLFPASSSKTRKGSRREVTSFFDSHIGSNERQVQAIEHILGFSSFPFPYILFGPPGTGKSSTVAEAIKQIHKSPNFSRILVCAPSNIAVDVLTEKILKDIHPGNVRRILARRHTQAYKSKKGVFRDALQCGFSKFEVSSWISVRSNESIIILCTSVMGYVLSKTVGRIFTHVFYDEAGFSSEPECLLAIKPHLNKSFIILSGDHYQLGPVIISQNKSCFGLSISLMERLMTCDTHYMLGSKGIFNPAFVTKLVHNYRSDSRLLKIPSEIFYDGELIAMAKPLPAITSAREKMGYRFPFVFIDVQGSKVRRPTGCTSIFNSLEVEVVQKVVNKLLTFEDISQRSFGVISPYRAQYMQIESMLHYCPRIEFGSPELFQGKEKDIILISTTRSSWKSQSLGFLSNFKRFNVAITRARYLCILVGDSCLLKKDPMWNALIQYIQENGGFLTECTDNNDSSVQSVMDALGKMSFI